MLPSPRWSLNVDRHPTTHRKIFGFVWFWIGLIIAIAAQDTALIRAANVTVACNANATTRANDLITAIQSAVTAGSTQTINLTSSCTYTLTAVNNGSGTDMNGLPVIQNTTTPVDLTINGNDATITRDSNADQFRIFKVASGNTLRLNQITISDGHAADGDTDQNGGDGGGIHNSGTVTISNSMIIDNASGDGDVGGSGGADGGKGAGIYNSSTLTVDHSIFDNNKAGAGHSGYLHQGKQGAGGAIYSSNQLTVTDSTFSNNNSGLGGGIENFGGTANVSGSTFVDNTAALGGGFSNYSGGTFNLTNSTVYSNDASDEGGGMWNDGTLLVIHSTVTGNTAPSNEGSGIYVEDSMATFRNSIVAGNTPGGNCGVAGGSPVITDGGYNIEDGTSCGFSAANNSQPSTDPKLDTNGLQSNGGPTKTIALQSTSPAINAIPTASCKDKNNNPLTTDQRGVTRPQAMHCDIGAYEALAGTILLREVTTPASANTSFAFTAGGGLTPTSFILTHNQTRTFSDLVPAIGYNLVQNNQLIPPGWHLASATCDNGDAPGSITVNEGQTVTCTFTDAINQSDLQLTKQGNPNPVPAGQNLTYTLTVTNLGPDAAAGVTVTDHLPASAQFVSVSNQGACSFDANTHKVTCSLGNLAVGAQLPISITVIAPTAMSQIDNAASVLAGTNDPNLLNNLAGANIAVVLGPFFDMFQTDQGQALNLLQGNTVLPNLQGAINALKASNSAGALSSLNAAQGEVSQVQGLVVQMKSVRDLIAQVLGQAQLGKSARKINQQLERARKALDQATDQLASCAGQIAAGIGLLETNDSSLLKGALSDAKLALQSCKKAVSALKTAQSAINAVQQAAQQAGVPLAKNAFTEPTVEMNYGQITLRWAGAGELEFFDLSGKRVLELKSNGSAEMRWPLMSERGEPLANGVYLYAVTLRSVDGKIVHTEVQKLIIVR